MRCFQRFVKVKVNVRQRKFERFFARVVQKILVEKKGVFQVYRFEKFMAVFLLGGFMVLAGVVGYYCGMYRAVVDAKIAVEDGLVILELNGQIYEHIAERVCE